MLNENIKALRKAKGLSQEELAIKLNVVRQTVSKWEKGLSVPDAGMVIQISEVLDTTVNVLLGEEIPKSEEPDFIKTLAAKLEVLNEQYSKQNEKRRKIWRVVFTVVLAVSVVSLIRYLFFFGSIYQMKNIGDTSTSVTVIGGADVPAYIPIWYYFSVSFPESGFLPQKKCHAPARSSTRFQSYSVLSGFSLFLKECGYRCLAQHFQSSLRFVSRWKGTQIGLKHSYHILLSKPVVPV